MNDSSFRTSNLVSSCFAARGLSQFFFVRKSKSPRHTDFTSSRKDTYPTLSRSLFAPRAFNTNSFNEERYVRRKKTEEINILTNLEPEKTSAKKTPQLQLNRINGPFLSGGLPSPPLPFLEVIACNPADKKKNDQESSKGFD